MENDLISRHGVSAWLANMGYSKLADVVMDEDRFPSAQPETHDKRAETHACDLIERQDAIDALDEIRHVLDTKEKQLTILPSAQPEIIRCKDCKYCDRGIDEDGNPFLKCLGWVYGGTQGEDFCSHAERRTDE